MTKLQKIHTIVTETLAIVHSVTGSAILFLAAAWLWNHQGTILPLVNGR